MRRRLGDDRRTSFALRRSAPERSERTDRSAFCLSREMRCSQAISLREIVERREGEVNEGHVTRNSSALSRDELRSCDRTPRLE